MSKPKSESELYRCRCGTDVTIDGDVRKVHCSRCSSLMLPADEYSKKYPNEPVDRHDHPWEDVHGRAMDITTSLVKSGYSGQDIMAIASQLLHNGIFVTIKTGADWMRDDADRKIDLKITAYGDSVLRVERAENES